MCGIRSFKRSEVETLSVNAYFRAILVKVRNVLDTPRILVGLCPCGVLSRCYLTQIRQAVVSLITVYMVYYKFFLASMKRTIYDTMKIDGVIFAISV